MSALELHLNRLDFSTQLGELKNLLNAAETKVTFWGSRIIEVDGYEGSIYLDNICHRIYRVSRDCRESDVLTLEERMNGIELGRKLEHFYGVSDNQVQHYNFFTRFVVWIREFSCMKLVGSYFRATALIELNFREFSREKVIEEFGDNFTGYQHPACEDFSDNGERPLRFLVREEAIREKLSRV